MAENKPARKKIIRHQLSVTCSIDEGVPAVFLCNRCKKPYCEDCIGHESARETLCLHCAAVGDSKKDEARRKISFPVVPKKKTLYMTFGVLASLGIIFNMYILLSDKLESDASQAIEPNISLQLKGISDCKANLEALAAEASSYNKTFDRPPYSMDDLSSMLGISGKTEDPITLKLYIIDYDGEHSIIRCPNPEEHGVTSITAVPGKPARVVYSNTRSIP